MELRALAHPLRLRILEQLNEPASAAEVARRLEESRQNVNYHLKELEHAGLVQRVGERRARAFVETLYRADTGAFVVSVVGSWPMVDCDAPLQQTVARRRGRTTPDFRGGVASIHLAAEAEAPTVAVAEVNAVAGRGLEGDRYFERAGTFSERPGSGRHLTLIESEVLEALRLEGIDLGPGDARRNVVTSGVPLNHLVGHELRIGEVVVRCTRLCEPCSHLAGLTMPEVLPALVHRGGLRVDIVRSGVIRAGDEIVPVNQ